MKHLSLLLFVSLSACAPLTTYYRAGISVERLERDDTSCDVKALAQAPVANQTVVEPPRYVPRRQRCNSTGECTYSGGYFVPGPRYTVDANANLRKRVKNICMKDLGYTPVQIPQCPQAIANAARPGKTQILPELIERSCVIRNKDGSVQIVNKG